MESGSAEGGRRGRSAAVVAADGGLKKGPWSAVEDEILVEYVKRHGEGNWNAVQRNSGLMRCGKSCRLRWANHLRPNLKKGSFSPEEEKLIIELHAKLGNKWARMASQLPGRTDNEIKNYWNTRLKRRQRAGLPLYPQDLQQEAHRPPPERHHYGFHGGRRQPTLSHHDSLSEVSLASFLNLPQKHQLNRPMEIPPPANSIVYSSDQFAGCSVPLSSFCDPSSAAVTSFLLFGQHLPTTDLHQPPTNYHLQLDSGGFDCISAVSAMNLNTTQAPPVQTHMVSTQSSSSSSGFIGPFSGETVEVSGNAFANHDDVIAPVGVLQDNSGLLGDVLKESVALKQKNRAQERSLAPAATKGKEVAADWDGQSSTGLMKRSEQGVKMVEEDMKNYMDDELLSLLNSFPAAAPLPDWYPRTSDELTSQNNCSRNHDQWTGWNNMPGFSTSDESREVLHFL